MSSGIATVIFALGILGLFFLDRNPSERTAPALWIPTLWFMISSSRPVAQWFGVTGGYESGDPTVESNPLDATILAILMTAGLIVLAVRRQQTSSLIRINGPLLVLILYGVISLLWSDYPFIAFKRWTKYLGSVLMIFVILTDPDPSAAIKRLLSRCGFVLIPISILLIKYYPELGRIYSIWGGTAVYSGVSDAGKNGLGWVCLTFGLYSFWRFLDAFQASERARVTGSLVAHGTILGMALWLLYMANSSAATACFLIGGGVVVLTTWRAIALKPGAIMHILVVSIMSLSFYGVIIDTSVGLANAVGRDASLTGRTELWQDLIRLSVDQWVGTGIDSFWLGERTNILWAKYWWHPTQAHNGYLEVFLNLGWIGVALLGFIIIWGYRNVIDSLNRGDNFGRLKLAYLLVVVILNLTEATFRAMNPLWLAFLLTVLMMPGHEKRA